MLVKKWSEALVLYDRVLKYAEEVGADAGTFKNSLKVSHCLLSAQAPGRQVGRCVAVSGLHWLHPFPSWSPYDLMHP